MKYAGHSWSKQALGYLADKNIIRYLNKDNRYKYSKIYLSER